MTSRTAKWLLSAGAIGFAGVLAVRTKRENLTGQTVLITGGSRGLGLALARAFGRQGCRIAICARNSDELERARQMLAQEGHEVYAVVCDITEQDGVNRMISSVRRHYGQIDILVNNAGEILVASFENTTIGDFESAMNVMFWGGLYTTLAVLPEMQARQSGRIVAITSIGGKVTVPHLLAYSCAKAASIALFEGLRAELSKDGIRVTTIVPGLMRTGADVQANFKGHHSSEFAWFSAAASLPFVSMNAERAASQIVAAIRQSRSERILSLQANVLARLHGAFPGLIPTVLQFVNRLLPPPNDDAETKIKGVQLAADRGKMAEALTALGRNAGKRLNQPAVPSA